MTAPVADATNWTSPAALAAFASAAVALIVGVGSFIASWMTNRSARKQQQRQLQHDATERDRERTMALKREVYIPAAQAILRMQNVLGSLTNPDADHTALTNQLTEGLAAIGKIHVVGSEATVRAAMAYVDKAMAAFLRILSMRADLLARKQSIAIAQQLAAQAADEAQRIVELLKQGELDGTLELERHSRLTQRLQTVEAEHQRRSAEYVELTRQQAVMQVDVFEGGMALTAGLSNAICEAVLAARNDLELPIDAEEYRAMYTEQQMAMARASAEAMADLRRRTRPREPNQ